LRQGTRTFGHLDLTAVLGTLRCARGHANGQRMPDARETLQQLWLKHAKGIGTETPSMSLLSQLVNAWSAPHRHYHSLRHLQECLQLLERWGRDEAARHEVGIALWFHDAVYDPRREDNEDRSARWAVTALKDLGVPEDKRRRVAKLIRATRHTVPSARARPGRIDGLDLMLDIDLAILGADRARFEEYERQVRLEYAHVGDEAFARARADFVEALLGVCPLYRTAVARSELEARARENLSRSMRALRGD
jgi:predicted metal-dependent HD superfamily phosphohydrolase